MKKILLAILVVCSIVLLCACSQVRKYYLTCENGDKIEIAVDGKGGYTTEKGANLEIFKDGNLVFECKPLKGELYDELVIIANQDKSVNILDQGTKGNNRYIFYENKNEYNVVELIYGTSTAILFTGTSSKEDAESTYAQITCMKK